MNVGAAVVVHLEGGGAWFFGCRLDLLIEQAWRSVLLLLNSSSRGKLGRPVGKCGAVENWVPDVHADRLGVSRPLFSLQVGRARVPGNMAFAGVYKITAGVENR